MVVEQEKEGFGPRLEVYTVITKKLGIVEKEPQSHDHGSMSIIQYAGPPYVSLYL